MKAFGWVRPVRGADGSIIGTKESPVKVRTVVPLGAGYGPDADKRLVFVFLLGDVIAVRPERTSRVLFIEAKALYGQLVRKDAERQRREKAAARKAGR